MDHGLRILGGGMRLEIPWPDLASYPSYGLVRPRQDSTRSWPRAQRLGAQLREQTTAIDAIRDERTGRVTGVVTKDGQAVRAPITLVADGNSRGSPLPRSATARGRPMGVRTAAITRVRGNDDDWLESWLELWDGEPGASRCCPATAGCSAWAMDEQRRPRILNTSDAFARPTTRTCSTSVRVDAGGVGFTPGDATAPIRGSRLPMGFNRQAHYADGALLVGDAAGMAPMNARHSVRDGVGRMAAEVIRSAVEPEGNRRETSCSYSKASTRYGRLLHDRSDLR